MLNKRKKIKICNLSELIEGKPTPFLVDGINIVLVKDGNKLYCLEDRCTHQDVPLSTGEVSLQGRYIECIAHGARFDLSSGKVLRMPAVEPVRKFETVVEDGVVFILTED